jgi:hypothetical protein
MNGVAGQNSLRLTTRCTGPVAPSRWNTPSTAPTPPAVQYGRDPSTPSSLPTSMLRVQTWVSRLGLSLVSTMDSGPRFEALVAVGSYPSAPAADGRDWKYCVSGLPFLSTKDCPISELPTSVLPAVTIEPSARCRSPGIWPIAVSTSG